MFLYVIPNCLCKKRKGEKKLFRCFDGVFECFFFVAKSVSIRS